MNDVTVHIGLLYVDLFMGESHSLKEKRMILKGLKERIRSKFNVSVSELDKQDKWQAAILGFAMLNSDQRHIDQAFQYILTFIESHSSVIISDQRIEFI